MISSYFEEKITVVCSFFAILEENIVVAQNFYILTTKTYSSLHLTAIVHSIH